MVRSPRRSPGSWQTRFVVDFDALEAAGIADARRRAPLIEYLDGLGFTAEQMVTAERQGRLFGLAGDVVQWSGQPSHSLTAAAEALGLPLADVEQAWAVLGLTVADPNTPTLTDNDIEALRTWADLRTAIGDDAATGFLRVIGASVARVAEALASMSRAGLPELDLAHSHDELVTAQAYRSAAAFIPRIGGMIDSFHRHHLFAARTYFDAVARREPLTVDCGVGFADLSNFTQLTQRLTPADLTSLLNEFNAITNDVVHADGGRVVKFIGDAVMWVSATPESLARVAMDLVHHPRPKMAHISVRAGLSFGSVVATGGDYFGNPVNLAARLVAAAEPGQILVAAPWYDMPGKWPVAPREPLVLKGFNDPVTAFELCPEAERAARQA
ncbi:adenylate/guanylate cyclase domain-containing protein [Mycobacterium sp. SMC-18]|uniref:adenylate/guanylate cyclase domain-containing protein n=1 Tax=Mycobacteriaceae TaxID=1762 RepID=UPI001BB33DA6|nr:adenylate/guanylate cyclase domain-containing protein [Mycolicibacterium sp. TY66]BCJ79807.1 adenylate/guanylate cyclase domain-containing protein [Mycolicibacterium sp. TY81]